ncbi:protein of unknown function DUF87 [Thermobaculum terrenum ATCC BAA-798]|uniref:Helicase HerA central domain-containing protein n=1 Tax=Thermobaculum terrenum (strain ATCC BAA-798 / CCMEE 7001 / YNP1) TaxID=525904 RepID=D1CDB8_THET1|nr:ATP-binding protein [Thermobaculum terrenum]ACZ42783.1 protein of unknown function DUF87 [Thermobaculum terrenum ATCC BAA-798]
MITKQEVLPVGIAKGPGESPHEYTFISPDHSQQLKNGEFVYYYMDIDGYPHKIIGQVVSREPVKLFPDAFLSDPLIKPADIARTIGYKDQNSELFEIGVAVLGYYDEQFGAFVNPRIPPSCGKPIYLAEDELLRNTLSKKKMGERGSAHIGSLLSRTSDAVPIVLDVKEFTSTHMAIIASTGAGKSYLAGVIVEELMSPANKGCVLIIDPHAEYETLTELPNVEQLREKNSTTDYRPRTRIFPPKHIKVKLSSLEFSDFRYLLPNTSDRMEHILREAHKRLVNDRDNSNWGKDELQVAIRQVAEDLESSQSGSSDYSSTAEALCWRIDHIFGQSNFTKSEHLDLKEILKPGQCTIIQLNNIDEKQQQVIVSTLLRRIYRSRQRTMRRENKPLDEDYIPYPVFILIEEAHHYAPASGDAVSTGILKQILAEGRKFGVGVGLISQRPGKLDSDVLSQCMTQFIMKVVNPIDQNSIASSVESASREILRELPSLSKGQVIVTGNSLNAPVLCRVRTRYTSHGGQSIDAPDEWNRWYEPDSIGLRRAEESVFVPNGKKGRNSLF